jgi:hypothetical protein
MLRVFSGKRVSAVSVHPQRLMLILAFSRGRVVGRATAFGQRQIDLMSGCDCRLCHDQRKSVLILICSTPCVEGFYFMLRLC